MPSLGSSLYGSKQPTYTHTHIRWYCKDKHKEKHSRIWSHFLVVNWPNKWFRGTLMSTCPAEAPPTPPPPSTLWQSPLSQLSKTCALICLSHTAGMPIEIPLIWELCLGRTRSRRSWSLTHTYAQKEWADGSGFHYREKKKRERLFIPYEGHIPEHAALLPQETWGKVGGAKECTEGKDAFKRRKWETQR